MIFWGAKNIAGECSLKIPYSTIAVNGIIVAEKLQLDTLHLSYTHIKGQFSSKTLLGVILLFNSLLCKTVC